MLRSLVGSEMCIRDRFYSKATLLTSAYAKKFCNPKKNVKDTVDSVRYTQNRVFEQSLIRFSHFCEVHDHATFGERPAYDRNCVSENTRIMICAEFPSLGWAVMTVQTSSRMCATPAPRTGSPYPRSENSADNFQALHSFSRNAVSIVCYGPFPKFA